MIKTSKKLTEHGAIVTRSLEQVLHKLARLLVGRMSLARLQELIRKVYVQEAERRLKSDFPQKRVTLSQLAVLTGLDTRTLNKLSNKPSYSIPAHEDDDFLSTMTPETMIIAFWTSDSQFVIAETGEPRTLTINEGQFSFANLVRQAVTGRGHTYQAILNRMKHANSVRVDAERQLVSLISDAYYPFLSDDESGMLDVGFSTAAALLGTVATNIEHSKTGHDKLFQRSAFTHTLGRERRAEFKAQMGEFLEQSDQQSKTLISKLEDKAQRPGQMTAGVSMFYFETNSRK